jgi:WXG100 family type VII secretion target
MGGKMSNGGVSAADGALARGAKIVANAKQQLDQEMKTLESRLQSLQWQGSGASSFRTLMERWNQDQRKLTGALDTFEQNLLSSGKTYEEKDTAAKSKMDKHAAGLGG